MTAVGQPAAMLAAFYDNDVCLPLVGLAVKNTRHKASSNIIHNSRHVVYK
jgi:hypothetical protein